MSGPLNEKGAAPASAAPIVPIAASFADDEIEHNTQPAPFNPIQRNLIIATAIEWRAENIKHVSRPRVNQSDALAAGMRRQFIRDALADMARCLEGMSLALLDEADDTAELYWLAARAIGGDVSKTLRILLHGERG